MAVEEEFQRGSFAEAPKAWQERSQPEAEGAASGYEAQNRISPERAKPASVAKKTFMLPLQGYSLF